MSYKSSTSASATFNFRADLNVKCFDDNFEAEVDQAFLHVEQQNAHVLASFEALVILTDLRDPKLQAHITIDTTRFRLSNLEKIYKFTASSDDVLIDKITSEDERVRRRFYDVIDDWTEFELHVYAAD